MAGRNKNELGEQTHFIRSVRQIGGYGRKISHRFQIGIPDLLLVIPGYVPGIWEMKDFGEWNKDTERQLEVTEKQEIELMEFDKACKVKLQDIGYSACGVLFTYKARGQRFMAICGYSIEKVRQNQHPTIIRETRNGSPFYDAEKLFNAYNVQQVKYGQ